MRVHALARTRVSSSYTGSQHLPLLIFKPSHERKTTKKRLTVIVPNTATLIKPSPGFAKKLLSDHKVDALALCGFGCVYCSSNWGNFLRIRRERFADLTEQQLGTRHYPDTTPELTMQFEDVAGQLREELRDKPKKLGAGNTLVLSMLTDAFSPNLEKKGVTREIAELLLTKTSYRVRVLTKSARVGSAEWIAFLKPYGERVVVGLSIGSTNDDWARRAEIGTSLPSARIRAHQRLQDAGLPTFGMLCPVMPEVLEGDNLERLVAQIRPQQCEHIWAEPYNDRTNWEALRDTYPANSAHYRWFNEVFEQRNTQIWSEYALELYQRLRTMAEREGWLHKLRYLLYEYHVTDQVAPSFGDLKGILLQSEPEADGLSGHGGFRAAQLLNRSK